MADNINLATFQFDTAKLEQSLISLQDTMFKLKKNQEGINGAYKEAQKEINETVKAQTALLKAGQSQGEEYRKNAERLKELNVIQSENYKRQQDVASQMARVRQEVTATNTQLKAYMNTEAQQQSLITSGNKALSTQITNINQARASNTELLRVRNQLNPTIEEEAKMIALLNGKLNENNNFIKANVSQYEQQKINIGNYTQSIKDALSSVTLFGVNLGSLKATMEPLTGILTTMKDQVAGYGSQIKNSAAGTEGMTQAQKAMTIATNVATGATKILTLALAATGIGLIIAAVVLLMGYLKTFTPIVDKVEQAMAGMGAVIKVVQQGIMVFVDGLSDLEGTLKSIGGFLSNPVKGFKDMGKAMGEAYDAAVQLKKAQQDLEDGLEQQEVASARNRAEINKLTIMARDRTKSEEERLKLLKQAETLENADFQQRKKLVDQELALAQEKIRQDAKLTASEFAELKKRGLQYKEFVEGRTNDTDALFETLKAAQLKEADIDNEYYQNIEKNILRQNKLIEDAEAAAQKAAEEQKKREEDAIANAQKKADAAIKAMQTELDFYLESQGDRKKDMVEQLAIDKETMKQQLAITKAEYDAKKLTKREFELANLEITNEFAAKQTEATIANAEMEFEIFKMNHQRKIDENTFFSEQLYEQELERINKIAEAEAAQATLKYEQGIINAQEYALAIRQVDENQRVANEAVDAERDQAKKDQQAADLMIQDELDGQRFEYDLTLANERYEREYAERKAAAIRANADMVAFEKSENAKKITMEQAVQANKRDLAAQTFGDIAKLLGESTAAGKAAAIAQATIDTYSGVAAVWSTPSVVPEPFATAIKVVSTGVVLASGLANVKKIVAVKPGGSGGGGQTAPSYATGIVGVGTGTSDSIQANLSAGESVLTARATQMFPREIAAINQAGGGVGLNGALQGSSSAMVQDSIRSAADSSMNVELIAEAVMRGAQLGTESGSQEGIRNLSRERKIMNDAQF